MKRKNSPAHLGGVPAGSGSSGLGRIPSLERARYIVGKRPSVNALTRGETPGAATAPAAMKSPRGHASCGGAKKGTWGQMSSAHRGRSIGIAAASLAVHAALLTLVALHAPRLIAPPVASGPPDAVIPVLIVARIPPPHASRNAQATPLRLHRRPQRFADETLPIAPLIVPAVEVERPAPVEPARSTSGQPAQEALAANVRGALRSRAGCDSPNLTRAEREGCLDRLGAGAGDAPFLGLGVERGKAGALGRAAARREADYRYQRGLPGPPVPVPVGAGWNGQRSPPKGAPNTGIGASPEQLGAVPVTVPF